MDPVILVSIDGMRPDGFQQAETPTIDAIIKRGAHTFNAQTVRPPITLPCHTSMFRGVAPDKHGITSNIWAPMARPIPSIVELVHRAGGKTAAFYNWEQLRDLSGPGALDFAFYWGFRNDENIEGDIVVARAAIDYIRTQQPDFAFVYLGWTDEVGHKHGWMSDQYIHAISRADAALGEIIASLQETGRLEQTTILVQSDHGGHGFTHTGEPEDMQIPWIIAGPRIKQGYTITGDVSIINTAPTLAKVVGVTPAPEWTGVPVVEAFNDE